MDNIVYGWDKVLSKEEFIEYMNENHVSENVISKFKSVPESIEKNGFIYDLYINISWRNVGKTQYNFELNYYCPDIIEFLFTLKILPNIEDEINHLLYELNKCNLL